MRRVLTPFNVICLLLFAASVAAYLLVQEEPELSGVPVYGEAGEVTDVAVTLYFSDADVQAFRTEERRISVQRDTPLNVAQAALAGLVAGPSGDGLAVLPPNSEVPDVWVRGEHFFVNLPGSYTRLNYGTSGENMLVCSITRTLLDVRGARDVSFLVGGRSADTLLGHLDLREPFTREDCN